MDFKLYTKHPSLLPVFTDPGNSGMDLRANVENAISLAPGERRLIPTGVYVSLPHGYELQVRPRSGLALKNGVTVLNAPGTIDANYRGEIGVILINHDRENYFTVSPGDRIAQAVIQKTEHPVFTVVGSVEMLDESERGSAGFGSSGVQ